MYYQAISDRIILAKYKGGPVDILIIQVYAPTTAADDEEIEQFYDELDCWSASSYCYIINAGLKL